MRAVAPGGNSMMRPLPQHQMSASLGVEVTEHRDGADTKQQVGRITVGMTDCHWAQVVCHHWHDRTFVWVSQVGEAAI